MRWLSAVIAIVIILLLLFIFGLDIHIIMMIVLGICALLVLFLMLFFIWAFVRLMRTEKTVAQFARIERKTWDGADFDRVFYYVDGDEYMNAFPAEVAFRENIYMPDREVEVRINRKKGYVFDRNASTCCILGFAIALCIIVAGAGIAAAVLLG